MCMLSRRLQILLDEERYERVAAAAQGRGVSVARVIREAIDAMLPGSAHKKQSVARRILAAPRMPVPDPVGLAGEIEAIRTRRA